MMTLKRYVFNNGLDIVAPPKCGTRWLEGLDVNNRISKTYFDISELGNNLHSNTTFIWRPVREHFISALETDVKMVGDIRKVELYYESLISEHWYPYLYKELYPFWETYGFHFRKLRSISNLNSEAEDTEYGIARYKFNTNENCINNLSNDVLDRINILINNETKYLDSMISKQYSNYGWKEYSKLEDDVLDVYYHNISYKFEIKEKDKKLNELYKRINLLQFDLDREKKINHSLRLKLSEAKLPII